MHGGLLNVGKACTKLEYLILRELGSILRGNALCIFAENCRNLNLIDTSYEQLSDNGLLSFSELKYLRVLIAESCPLLTTDGIVNSMGNKKLKHLNILGCKQVDLHAIQRSIPNSWMPVRREGGRRNRRRRREYV